MPSGAPGGADTAPGYTREPVWPTWIAERVDDISNVSTIEEVHAMKRAHKGGTWKYACACRSGVRYEGESEA